MDKDDAVAGCVVMGVGCFLVVLQLAFYLGLFAGACWIVKAIFF